MSVIRAKAGIHGDSTALSWIPAFAGMTVFLIALLKVVVAGLGPAIHELVHDVDARNKSGHDEGAGTALAFQLSDSALDTRTQQASIATERHQPEAFRRELLGEFR
jgi:hypothetical protein